MTQTGEEQDELLESMLGDFLDESGEYLIALNENLLCLDDWVKADGAATAADADLPLLQEMFRAAHSLKGLSAMLGLKHINELTHKVENVFDAARNRELSITEEMVELVFQAVDRLTEMVEALKSASPVQVPCDEVIENIKHLLQQAGVEKQQLSQAEAQAAFTACQEDEPSQASPRGDTAQAADSHEAGAVPDAEMAGDEEAGPAVANANHELAAIVDDVDVSSKYFSMFIDEAEVSIDRMAELLLGVIEGTGPSEIGEPLLVIAHKIKGSAASIGLNRAAKLAHALEDLLQELTAQRQPVTRRLAEPLLETVDVLRGYAETLKQGELETPDFDLALEQIRTAHRQLGAIAPADQPLTDDGPPADAGLREHLSAISQRAPLTSSSAAGCVVFRPDLPLWELKARLILDKLANRGGLFYCSPSVEAIEQLDAPTPVVFGISTDAPLAALQSDLLVEGVADAHLEQVVPTGETTPEPPESVASEPSPRTAESAEGDAASSADTPPATRTPSTNYGRQTSKPVETVRVDIDRLDQLMNLAGQLVINRARFAQISDSLKHITSGTSNRRCLDGTRAAVDRIYHEANTRCDNSGGRVQLESIRNYAHRVQGELEAIQAQLANFDQVRNSVSEMLDAVHQLERVSDGIQKCVMDTRMVPIGPLFGRFKRVIRDITRSNKKEIALEIRGEKTELDKRMIDELGDPLIHMVRNSADHGIESPETRRAAGKNPQGTITLDAFHRGNSIIIRVADDGKGLDVEKIRAKAVQKGIVSQADTEKMSAHQIFQLIWEPGFSTAEQITEVSGRGMGMDIVRSKIEEINGSVELDSTPGVGTTITIKLPLTLAILPSLLAEIDDEVFALPVESVVEIVRLQSGDFSTAHGQRTASIRGRIVSVVDLGNLFQWSTPPKSPTSAAGGENHLLVIVGSEGKEVGLIVDELLGEEDIVIKSLAENYRNVDGIAGASILGDGRVSLIIDARALLELAAGRQIVAPAG